MRTFRRYQRTLMWIASLSGAAIVATFGATAVLAEGPACTGADGTPVTQEKLAADPSLCPAEGGGGDAAAPAPAPAPDPAPQPDPPATTPVEPGDSVPAPDPAPETPAPDAGTPATPAPDPATPDPSTPAPIEPADTTPAPDADDPARDTRAAEPVADEPVATDPIVEDPAATTDETTTPPAADPKKEKRPKPAAPIKEKHPVRVTPKPSMPKPKIDKPAEPVHEFVQAKLFQTVAFRDARLFREQYTPEGRIPEQPQLSEEDAAALIDGAAATDTSWTTLAAVSWIESRWGDPSAGALVGRRLTTDQFATFGTDGDDDGEVDERNPADRAATLGAFLDSFDEEEDGLSAYFTNTKREVVVERALFLGDYFDALGKKAVVKGLDDPEVRKHLAQRLLKNEDITVYDGGRSDIDAGLADPRMLVTLEFLANRFNTVSISSIISGHGVYTSAGNVSLHSYGQAVDVASLDGESILGNQGPGSNTERAVKELLLLPESMQSAELISLWDLGMPSFAMSDHHDHIHIGWKNELGPRLGDAS